MRAVALLVCAALAACGGPDVRQTNVVPEMRPDGVPCSVTPAWETPPEAIGEAPEPDALRQAWCAVEEGSGPVLLLQGGGPSGRPTIQLAPAP